MYEEQYKETYEVASAALSFHEGVTLAQADGKVELSDVMYLIEPMTKLPAGIEGAKKALEELKAMAPEARAELMAKLASEYDIADDVVEAKVEAGMECLLAIGKFVGVVTASAPTV